MMSAAQMLPEVEPPRTQATRPVAVETPKPAADLLPPANGAPAAARAGEMVANPESAPDVAARAKMSVGLQQQVGNARMGAMVTEEAPPPPPAPAKEAKEAKPAAAPPVEKPAEKPSEKVAKKSGEEEEKKPAPPSPKKAIAPAVAGVKDRAKRAKTKKVGAPGLVSSSQEAAKDPTIESERTASVATVQNLDSAEAKKVRKQKFKDDLTEAISKHMGQPTTKEEASAVMKTGGKKASEEMHQSLTTEREQAAGGMKTAVATEVQPAGGGKPANMVTEEVGAPPAPVSAAPVVPEPLPAERLDYSSDRGPTDNAMSEAGVTKTQLEKGNEPEFNKNLSQRADAEKHEAEAEGKYRKTETVIQGQTRIAAQGELKEEIGGMHGDRELRLGEITGQQNTTKTKDAAERERVTTTIGTIKTNTRKDVETILTDMEAEASRVFDEGLCKAEEKYEETFEEEKGGVGTWLTTWGDDWDELIERSLATAKRHYLRIVGEAIDEVSEVVDTAIVAAKKRVETGRKEVDDFVKGLEGKVQEFGLEAQKEVESDFASMETEIDQRRDALIDKLADQYKASYERMSAKEEALREANKSLWKRLYDATVGLIKKILAFKDMLMGVLAKAAEVVMDIISDPIGFLGNLVSAVMQGLENFMKNIGEHLQKGLMEWLFGALAGAGLQLPDSFDLKGIISIILQVLGLTYANFRARAVAIVGEEIVSALEQAAEVFKIVATQGVSGLWEFIKEKVEDLKSMVMDAIFDFIKERVIIAGVTWIIGLLNPASAFFKACKAIYDIVMFFINRGSQILALVNAIIDSIAAIAKGNLATAIKWVENALAKAIPVAIGFLAALLGLGDISGTIRKTIEKAQQPVNKAIDWVIHTAVKGVKAVGKAVGGLFEKKTPEKEKAQEKDDKPPATTDPEHDAKVEAGLAELDKRSDAHADENGAIDHAGAEEVAQSVRRDFPVFSSITVVQGKETWNYDYVASPGRIRTGEKISDADKIITITGKIMERPGWRPSTKEAVPITAGEDRRHIEAWQVMHEKMKLELNGKTVREGYDHLVALGYKPSRRRESEVLEAARECLRDQFNEITNVFAGPSAANQEYGRQFARAKKQVDAAIASGDRTSFDAGIAVLEQLWRDPETPVGMTGLENFTTQTVAMLRQKFEEKWGQPKP